MAESVNYSLGNAKTSRTAFTLGLTVFIGLVGTVLGTMTAGVLGQRIGGREALRIMAVLYTIPPCACVWNWPAPMVFRLIGGIGGSSSPNDRKLKFFGAVCAAPFVWFRTVSIMG